MTYTNMGDFNSTANSTGLIRLFEYTGNVVPNFFPLLSLAIFLVITLAIYQKSGRDFIQAFLIGSIINFLVVFILSLLPNIMPTYVVVISFTVMVITIVTMFLSDR